MRAKKFWGYRNAHLLLFSKGNRRIMCQQFLAQKNNNSKNIFLEQPLLFSIIFCSFKYSLKLITFLTIEKKKTAFPAVLLFFNCFCELTYTSCRLLYTAVILFMKFKNLLLCLVILMAYERRKKNAYAFVLSKDVFLPKRKKYF